MAKSSRPKTHVCLGVFCLVMALVICRNARAVVNEDAATKSIDQDSAPNDGSIEVLYEAEALAPFKDRRSKWSGLFGLSLVQLKPTKYGSRIDGISYDAVYGNKVPANVVQATIGGKYNFGFAGFGFEIFHGAGQNSGTVIDATSPANNETRTLDLTRSGLQLSLVFDNLFSEPYVAPYLAYQVFGMTYKEKSSTVEVSGTTAVTTGYSVGALLLLDWLDPDAALSAINAGVENTYLDLYLTQLFTSNSSQDPNLETAPNFGAGIKVEF